MFYKLCRGCRAKLNHPAEIEHTAFCSGHCFQKFYRVHCRVCSAELAPLANIRKVNLCSRGCRNTYRRKSSIYAGFSARLDRPGYWSSQACEVSPNSPDISTLFSALIADQHLIVWGAYGKRACDVLPDPRTGLFTVRYADRPVFDSSRPSQRCGLARHSTPIASVRPPGCAACRFRDRKGGDEHDPSAPSRRSQNQTRWPQRMGCSLPSP